VEVREAPHVRRVVDVEVALEGERLVALAAARGEQLAVARGARVGPAHDERRVVEHAVAVEDQHGDGARLAARQLHGAAVQTGDVPLLAVTDARVVEGPPRLLAEVAEGDGDERGHGCCPV
jgi:hypothetical protein